MSDRTRVRRRARGPQTITKRWDDEDTEYWTEMTTQADQCNRCQRRDATRAVRCGAFPDGIPIEILAGEFDHNRRHPDDGGLRRVAGEPSWNPGGDDML